MTVTRLSQHQSPPRTPTLPRRPPTVGAPARAAASAAELAAHVAQRRPLRPVGTEGRSVGTASAVTPYEGPTAVRFGAAVLLTKSEVFRACQGLADADRILRRHGGHEEAAALGDLFELLERRLAASVAVDG